MTIPALLRKNESNVGHFELSFPARPLEWGKMFAGLSIARCFLLAGAALALVSVLFWAFLPMRLVVPPYLITPLLALAYGYVCLRRVRVRSNRDA